MNKQFVLIIFSIFSIKKVNISRMADSKVQLIQAIALLHINTIRSTHLTAL